MSAPPEKRRPAPINAVGFDASVGLRLVQAFDDTENDALADGQRVHRQIVGVMTAVDASTAYSTTGHGNYRDKEFDENALPRATFRVAPAVFT